MTVLSIEPICDGLALFIIAILIVIMLISVCYTGVTILDSGFDKSTIFLLFPAIISLIGILLAVKFKPINVPNKYRYYVSIEDANKAPELLEGYTLIKQYGSLYYIEDK